MTERSFTVQNYASKVFHMSFDIVLNTPHIEEIPVSYKSYQQETIDIQSCNGFDRKLLLKSMYNDLIDIFGVDNGTVRVTVRFLNLKDGKPQYCYVVDNNCVTGGIIEISFPDIQYLPEVIRRVEEWMKRIRDSDDSKIPIIKTPIMKVVHLNTGMAPMCNIPKDVYMLKIKDGCITEVLPLGV